MQQGVRAALTDETIRAAFMGAELRNTTRRGLLHMRRSISCAYATGYNSDIRGIGTNAV